MEKAREAIEERDAAVADRLNLQKREEDLDLRRGFLEADLAAFEVRVTELEAREDALASGLRAVADREEGLKARALQLDARELEHAERGRQVEAEAKALEEKSAAYLAAAKALERQQVLLAEREAAIRAREEAAASTSGERDALSEVAARVTSIEAELQEARSSHEDHMKLCQMASRMGWQAYRDGCAAIAAMGLSRPVPPPDASWNTLGGLQQAFSGLTAALTGARAQLEDAMETEGREVGFRCALDALALVKSRHPGLDVPRLMLEGPDDARLEAAERECRAAAEQIVSVCLSERVPATDDLVVVSSDGGSVGD